MNAQFILYLSILVLGGVYGLLVYDRLDKPFRCVVWLLMITTLSEGLTRFEVMRPYNFNLYWIYALLYVVIYGRIFMLVLTNRIFKMLTLYTGVSILIAWPVCAFGFGMHRDFPSVYLIFAHLYFVLCCVFVFFELLNDLSDRPLHHREHFWLNSALFVYAGLSVFVLSFTRFTDGDLNSPLNPVVVNIHTFVCMAFYSVLGYALYLNAKNNRERDGR